ncbi:MAG TPA: MOSC domain-containing protein [Spirochaetia bacterium]|nr:MOSC domain-containing protein [Spirochaetia bacterium]
MKVAAIFVGKPGRVQIAGQTIFTGGSKSIVESALLRFGNFEGDGQGNLRYHGGKDRSVCVYVAEHYAWWKSSHGFDLRYGAFCENLTIEGALEDQVCIGDVFQAGDAQVQISLPRDPCRTIDLIAGVPGLWELARASGKLGFHMRTLKEGLVKKGDAFVLARRHPQGITVAQALDLFHGRSQDREIAERLAAMPEFGDQGKKHIAERLASSQR